MKFFIDEVHGYICDYLKHGCLPSFWLFLPFLCLLFMIFWAFSALSFADYSFPSSSSWLSSPSPGMAPSFPLILSLSSLLFFSSLSRSFFRLDVSCKQSFQPLKASSYSSLWSWWWSWSSPTRSSSWSPPPWPSSPPQSSRSLCPSTPPQQCSQFSCCWWWSWWLWIIRWWSRWP